MISFINDISDFHQKDTPLCYYSKGEFLFEGINAL